MTGLPILAAVLYALYLFVGVFGAQTLVKVLDKMPSGDYRIQNKKVTPPPRARIDESAALAPYAGPDPMAETPQTVRGRIGELYGPLKVVCEQDDTTTDGTDSTTASISRRPSSASESTNR